VRLYDDALVNIPNLEGLILASVVDHVQTAPDHPHIHQALTRKAPVYLEDARLAELTPAEKIVVDSRNLVSILYFPLVLKNTATGTFILGTTQQVRRFTPQEVDLCHVLAYQVSLAVDNAQLYQRAQQAIKEISQAYDATLEGWSRVLDLRDHVTEQHTHSVAELTVELAQRMNVPAGELGHIRRGALLHDIGKMGIPDEILQKPALLTEKETEIMRTHPEMAYRLLSPIAYLAPALDIPYCHHEKWDGSGYPRGLKGEEIPLAARLFAVVDVYDALIQERPYRKAWGKAEALQYIREQAGKHFDPEVVRAFLEIVAG
jgi:putative nucleotidyltransferase with HDIG domain